MLSINTLAFLKCGHFLSITFLYFCTIELQKYRGPLRLNCMNDLTIIIGQLGICLVDQYEDWRKAFKQTN